MSTGFKYTNILFTDIYAGNQCCFDLSETFLDILVFSLLITIFCDKSTFRIIQKMFAL
jgi:hypothetical protein